MSLFKAYTKAGYFPVMDYDKLSAIPTIIDDLGYAQRLQQSDTVYPYYVCNSIRKEFGECFDEAVANISKENDTNNQLIETFGVAGWVVAYAGVLSHTDSRSWDFGHLVKLTGVDSTREDATYYRVAWINHMIQEIQKVRQFL